MQRYGRLLLVALGAAAVLAATVGVASATRFEESSQSLRTVTERLEFIGFGGLFTVSCPVTVEGTLHSRTISKVSGALLGLITSAAVTSANCTGGSVTIPAASLPWHGRYDSFQGVLPRITALRGQLVGAAFQLRVRILGTEVLCLYKSTAREPAYGISEVDSETGRITGGRADETREIPFAEGGGSCPSSGRFRGRGTITVAGTTTAVTVRLVR
jgi:hypothetical protein